LALAVVAAAASLTSAAGVLPASAPAATLPPSLLAIEQKAAELKIASVRFSLTETLKLPKSSGPLAKLLRALADTSLSGQATLAPSASEISLELLGVKMNVRQVGTSVYVEIPKLAPKLSHLDHGRPWVKLGKGGIGELFTVNGKSLLGGKESKALTAPPAVTEPAFTKLFEELAGAHEVRERGAGTVAGQPVTSFAAVLEPSQLEAERSALSPPAAAAARRPRVHNPPPVPPPPKITLEASFAEDGLPVRTVIASEREGGGATAVLEIPAINFPLTIEPPPAAQTIGVARFRRLSKRYEAERRARRRRRKK
jgi:hypothetical protein